MLSMDWSIIQVKFWPGPFCEVLAKDVGLSNQRHPSNAEEEMIISCHTTEEQPW